MAFQRSSAIVPDRSFISNFFLVLWLFVVCISNGNHSYLSTERVAIIVMRIVHRRDFFDMITQYGYVVFIMIPLCVHINYFKTGYISRARQTFLSADSPVYFDSIKIPPF